MKRIILFVLSFILLMPSTAWGEEYTYDSFSGWDGNAGMYSCLTIDFQNSTTVYSPDKFSNISKVEIVAGGASQIYSSFAVSVNGSDYQSIVSTTGNGYVIPENVDYDTYSFTFTPEEEPQYIKISAQYNAMSGTQGWVYIKSVTVYTEEETDPEPYAVLSDNNKLLTFYYDGLKQARGGMGVGPFTAEFDSNYPLMVTSINSGWYEQKGSITKVVFDNSFANCTSITSTAYWFYEMSSLTAIEGIKNLNTQNVTSMRSMFRGCNKLTSLDVTGFNTQNVTDMYDMFDYCKSLTKLDVTHFDTKKVSDMGGMFYACSGLTSLDVRNFNTQNVTNMTSMFSSCSRLTNLDLTGFKTDNVTSLFEMFAECSGLTSLDVTGFNTQNVTDMAIMFAGCSGLTSLDLSGFNTKEVTDIRRMFRGCSSLTTIYTGNSWSTEKIELGGSMFLDCTNLKGGAGTTYDADHVDYTYAHIDGGTSNPGYFTQKDGPAMGSCDMSEVPTDNDFYAATSFLCERGILDGSKVNGKYLVEKELLRQHLANITFRGLFTLKGREIPSTFVSDQYPDIYDDLKSDAPYYQAAKTLLYLDYGDDITPFDRDRDGFFPDNNESRINILKELMEAFNIKPDTEGTDNPFPNEAEIAQLSETSPIRMGYVRQAAKLGIITTENEQFHPFKDCLRGEAFLMLARIIQKIEAGEITDPNPQESDFLDPNSGTGTAEPYAVLSNDNTVLTFYYDSKKSERGGMGIGPFSSSYHQGQGYQPNTSWYAQRESITSIVFNSSFANCTSITSTAYWFQDLRNLTSITGLQYLKTDNVTDMSNMFYGCQNLKNLDVSTFNTANVTNMNSMFNCCLYMQSLNVKGFNTSKVTSMKSMFYQCGWLRSLDLSSFNTESVTDMEYMFAFCGALSSLDISGFNTEKVTSMYGMFNGDESLKRLDLGSFNTPNLKYITRMFYGCSNLTTIFVGSGWTFSSISSGNEVFTDCTKLVGGAGTAYSSSHTDFTYACIDYGGLYCGYFTDKYAPVGTMPYAVFSENNTVMTLYYDDKKNIRGGWDAGPFTWSGERWNSNYDGVVTVIFDESFSDCTSITSTACWFTNFSSLETVSGLEYLKTDNVTNMSCMFYNCSKLTALDVSSFNTSNVTDMSFMFLGCSSLTTLDVSKFNTAKVTNMSCIFYDCSKLATLNVSNFKTSKVKNMNYMFYNCQSLTELDVSGFYAVKVTNMTGMFQLCSGLKNLDISRFNTSQVTNINQLFQGCSKLETVYVSDGWSTAAVSNGTEVFTGCTSLKGGTGTTYSSDHTDYTYACIDGGTDAPGYFTFRSVEPLPPGNPEPYALLSDNNTVLTFYCDGYKERYGGMDVGPVSLSGDYTNSEWNDSRKTVTKVVFDKSLANCTTITSTANWFRHFVALTTVEGMENLNACKIENMSGMFYNCFKLTNLDLSNFKTSDVTNMDHIFWRCGGLTSIDLSGFNTSNVTCMGGMFDMCSNLTSVKFGNLNTEKVTNMSNMFAYCSKLEEIDLSKFNTSQVTNISYMFQNCSALTSLDLSSFDTGNVKSCYSMFSGCTSLATIYVDKEKWSTQSVTQSWEMFKGCTSLVGGAGTPYDENHIDAAYACIDGGIDAPGYLTSVNDMPEPEPYSVYDNGTLSFYFDGNRVSRGGIIFGEDFPFYNWQKQKSDIVTVVFDPSFANYTSLTHTGYWFEDCNKLKTIMGLEYLKTENVTNMNNMFHNCTSLTSLDVSHFDTRNVIQMYLMFSNCSSLTSLDVSNFDTRNLKWLPYMFSGCSSLKSLDVSNFNTSNFEDINFLFQNCSSLTNIDIHNFDFGKVTYNSYGLFSNCTSLESIDLSGMDMCSVSMQRWFDGCSSLKNINLNGIKTENVKDMGGLFRGCSCLPGVDLSSLNTENVTSMWEIFSGCSCLTSLDLSHFNVSNVSDMYHMFYGCSNLGTIYCDDTWTADASQDLFTGCVKLTGYSEENANDVSYAKPIADGGYFTPSAFAHQCAKPVISVVDGKFVFDSTTEGVTYKATISKPVTGNSITLNDTYTVSVYATKEGYEDSDVVTVEVQLGIPGKNDDVDGDGKVTITDAETIMNIILEK